jgi:hypothetical protein
MKTSTRHGFVFVLLAVLGLPPAAARAQATFTHSISFKVPKSGGEDLGLGLVYAPGAGNGIVGVGWQLTGISTISRVNYGNGVKYGGGDTYAHSQLGVLVKQADGSYRSKSESFVKFVPQGVCGDGPCFGGRMIGLDAGTFTAMASPRAYMATAAPCTRGGLSGTVIRRSLLPVYV